MSQRRPYGKGICIRLAQGLPDVPESTRRCPHRESSVIRGRGHVGFAGNGWRPRSDSESSPGTGSERQAFPLESVVTDSPELVESVI